ncbi:MAG TPA: nuclear transport factor 2 family protein [Stenomitos sp.]
MAATVTERFMQALERLEREHKVGDLVALYAPDARVGNMLDPDSLEGPEGARGFWNLYRRTFGEIHSTFEHVLETERGAALEWVSEGTTPHGLPLRYRGVMLLEVAGDRIKRSCAYFDSATLGHQLSRGLQRAETGEGAQPSESEELPGGWMPLL